MRNMVKERDRALLSMDEQAIKAYAKKWGVTLPDKPEAFWAGVHKARTGCRSLPMPERQLSKSWLELRGLTSLDGGELDA